MSYILEVFYTEHFSEVKDSSCIEKIFKRFNTIEECHEMFYEHLCIKYEHDINENILIWMEDSDDKLDIPCDWATLFGYLFGNRDDTNELIFTYRIYDISNDNCNLVIDINENDYETINLQQLQPNTCFNEYIQWVENGCQNNGSFSNTCCGDHHDHDHNNHD